MPKHHAGLISMATLIAAVGLWTVVVGLWTVVALAETPPTAKVLDRLPQSGEATCTASRGGKLCVNALTEERTFVLSDPDMATTTLIRLPKSDVLPAGPVPTASNGGIVK